MMAWMNRAAFEETLRTGRAVYFSRSRGKLWRKGETSGHQQTVRKIQIDCDADCILLHVDQTGAACHEGYQSCFFRDVDESGEIKIEEPRLVDPNEVYGQNEFDRKSSPRPWLLFIRHELRLFTPRPVTDSGGTVERP